jgi:hypothetical protein
MMVLCSRTAGGFMHRIACIGWLALGGACDKATAPRDQEMKPPAAKTRVTITPVPDPVATRSIAIAGVLRGEIDTKLGAPYSFDVFLDGVQEKYSSPPYGYRQDSPMIFVPKPDGSLEFYATMRGLVSNGAHTVAVRVTDAAGLADSATTRVVTSVPDVMYAAELLPLPPGDTSGFAASINSSGAILGTAAGADGQRHLVVWRQGVASVVARSDTISFDSGSINDNGDIAATIITRGVSIPCRKAYVLRVGQSPIIADPAYPCQTTGADINNAGSVVMWGVNGTSGVFENGAYTELPRTLLLAINDLGAAVGQHFDEYGPVWPAYYRFSGISTAVTDMRAPASSAATLQMPPQPTGSAVAVNNRMHAVEWTKAPLDNVASWSLRQADGPLISFRPTLAGYNTDVTIVALSNDDVALAWDSTVSTAFFWQNGRASRLKVITPGITISYIRAMNDARVIIGMGHVGGKSGQEPIVLRPVGG